MRLLRRLGSRCARTPPCRFETRCEAGARASFVLEQKGPPKSAALKADAAQGIKYRSRSRRSIARTRPGGTLRYIKGSRSDCRSSASHLARNLFRFTRVNPHSRLGDLDQPTTMGTSRELNLRTGDRRGALGLAYLPALLALRDLHVTTFRSGYALRQDFVCACAAAGATINLFRRNPVRHRRPQLQYPICTMQQKATSCLKGEF